MNSLDNLLNKITMYKLVEYYLLALLGIAATLGFLGIVPLNGFSIIASASIVVGAAWVTNRLFAWAFDAPVHDDSAIITGLILALIISPLGLTTTIGFLIWAGILSMAAKYLLAIKKQHIFNPAAVAVVITSLALGQNASWWIDNLKLLPFVIIGGILILRKLQKFDIFLAFALTMLAGTFVLALLGGGDAISSVYKELTLSPLFYFGFVMLTEPVTMPGSRILRLLYAAAIGLVLAPQFHLGSVYFSPELALVLANGLFFLVAPRTRHILTYQGKQLIAKDTYDFFFESDSRIPYRAGQYLELILAHNNPDTRGTRRYFTIASSPDEQFLRLGIKFSNPGSSFKAALLALKPGQQLVASQIAGDFTLAGPQNKYVFIAGGIGITPFRAMIADLIAQKQKVDSVLLYSASTPVDLAYRDLFDSPEAIATGFRAFYTVTRPPSDTSWRGNVGMLSADIIRATLPDFTERIFYISGPHSMVNGFKKTLAEAGVPKDQIRTDFFPGFA